MRTASCQVARPGRRGPITEKKKAGEVFALSRLPNRNFVYALACFSANSPIIGSLNFWP